jgi:uncharacterized protein YdbL (DUF1318 family)
MNKGLISGLVMLTVPLSLSFSASAITLQQARQQGLVGETSGGYLAVRVASDNVTTLVAEINQQRQQQYQRLAQENHLPRESIASMAGRKLQQRALSGEFILNPQQQWIKK